MDVLVIAHFTGNLDGTDNNRFIYLCKLLKSKTEDTIELVTSDFSHGRKCKKKPKYELYDYKITLLHEPGYFKNVCLRRFYSHYEFGRNVNKYLHERKKPDAIYCAVPSLDCAFYAANFAKRNNIRFIIDVQDLWPEAFKMVFHIPVISNLVFAPMERRANQIYSYADAIVAVSQTYIRRALRVNKKCKEGTVVYLGTDRIIFDRYARREKTNGDKIRIVYIGTLGKSYDLANVIRAVKKLTGKRVIQLIIMGDGPQRSQLQKQAEVAGINCLFTGILPYPQMVKRLCVCDIAVNPIHAGSAGSIINKVNDYAMAGLPVVNTQECREYRELLDKYHAGINCECENAESIAVALQRLIDDNDYRLEMGINSRRMGEEIFDRSLSYHKLINILYKN